MDRMTDDSCWRMQASEPVHGLTPYCRFGRVAAGRWNAVGVADRLVRAGRDDVAVTVLRRHARRGNPSVQWALGHLLLFGDSRLRRPGEGREWLRRAARCGQANAPADLARIRSGRNGLVFEEMPSSPKRLGLMLRAARRGAAEAQHAVASAYISGYGLAYDPERARSWYARAARGGLHEAMYTLGMMWLTGEGGKKDLREAARWLEACAAGGAEEGPHAVYAAELLGDLYAGAYDPAMQDRNARAHWDQFAERIEAAWHGVDY